MINISENKPIAPDHFSLFELGFRPFFLVGAIFAIVSIAIWALDYSAVIALPLFSMTSQTWHAHEMVYGFSFAVIAGFLLTAVKNWTGKVTAEGLPLVIIFMCWFAARVALLIGTQAAFYAAIFFDVLFSVLLLIALSIPILKSHAWVQLAILSKILLLAITNTLFYLGVLGFVDNGINWGIYGGVYLVLAMVFTMARRVIPFFIQNGVDEKIKIENRAWIDISSLVLFFIFAFFEVFTSYGLIVAGLAGVLALIHGIRLWSWYDHQIWSKPLLWPLLAAYAFFIVGFVLKVLSYTHQLSPFLSLHAFTYGGVAMMVLSMMARVTLGHTGRNVFAPPKVIVWIFIMILLGAISRVFLPIFNIENYVTWVLLSQILWIMAFSLFVIVYGKMFIKPRVDGKPG